MRERRKNTALLLLPALLMPGLPRSVAAQSVVRVDVGASSHHDAYATRAQWYGERTRGWLALAGGGEPSLGGWIQTRIRGLHVGAGDATIDLALPTDRLGGSPGLLGRGLVLADSAGSFRWSGFAGWGARARSPVPGLVTADAGGRVARLDAEWALTSELRWHGLQTWAPGGRSHVQSLTWEPTDRVRMDASAGRMEGAPYGALAGTLVTRHLELVALWTHTPRPLRRLAAADLLFAENAGLNGRVVWRPRQGWYVEASRSRRNPSTLVADPAPPRTIHQVGAGLSLGRRFSVRGGVHHSPDPAGGEGSRGARLGLAARVSPSVQGDVSYYRSRTARSGTREMAVVTVRERVRSSVELLQRLSFDAWELPSVSLGGRYERGGSSIGVDYRTDFVPSASGSQFRTALVLGVRLQLSPTRDITATTYVDGLGNAHYQARAGQWLYPGAAGASATSGAPRGAPAPAYRFPDHVVRGRVELDDGTPVEGAAIALGGHVVHTNGQGRFLLRTDEATTLSLEVRTEDFLVPGDFRVLEAPDEVTASPEEGAPEVVVVVERVLRQRVDAGSGRR